MGTAAGTTAGTTTKISAAPATPATRAARSAMPAGRYGTPPAEPSRHQLALMVWTAIVPTVTFLQFALGDLLQRAPMYLRAPIMATCAVPIVVYVAMPHLQRLRARLINRLIKE